MGKRRAQGSAKAAGDSEKERLATLNAQLRVKGNVAEMIRRSIEGQIEAKAKRRRSREKPVSSAFKR